MITRNSTTFLHQNDPREVFTPTEDSVEYLVDYNFNSQQIEKRSVVKHRNNGGISDEEFISNWNDSLVIHTYGHGHFVYVKGCGGVCKKPNMHKEKCCNKHAVVDILNPKWFFGDEIEKIRIESIPIVYNLSEEEYIRIRVTTIEGEIEFNPPRVIEKNFFEGSRLLDYLCFCAKSGEYTPFSPTLS